MPYVGNDITLVCEIQLPGVVSPTDVDVSVRWLRGGSEFSGVPGRVTVATLTTPDSTVQSTVSFSPPCPLMVGGMSVRPPSLLNTEPLLHLLWHLETFN